MTELTWPFSEVFVPPFHTELDSNGTFFQCYVSSPTILFPLLAAFRTVESVHAGLPLFPVTRRRILTPHRSFFSRHSTSMVEMAPYLCHPYRPLMNRWCPPDCTSLEPRRTLRSASYDASRISPFLCSSIVSSLFFLRSVHTSPNRPLPEVPFEAVLGLNSVFCPRRVLELRDSSSFPLIWVVERSTHPIEGACPAPAVVLVFALPFLRRMGREGPRASLPSVSVREPALMSFFFPINKLHSWRFGFPISFASLCISPELFVRDPFFSLRSPV